MTNGVLSGISGAEWRAFRRAWLALAVLVACIDTVNVTTTLQDHANAGRPLALWEPMVWEYTSGLCAALLAPLVFLAVRAAPPQPGRWPRFVLLHAAASLAFSGLHVGGMLALRALIYAAAGSVYRERLGSFPYEYRKDLVAYAIMGGAFWLALKLAERHPQAPAPGERPTFDIRDGARLLRVPVADIVSVASAGNYVEFVLADGRRPLMRATLASLEARLAPYGLVRTHRSWLVNAGRVSGLAAAGSGDFTVELDTGVTAPLSRRFPQALDRLRSGGGESGLSEPARMS